MNLADSLLSRLPALQARLHEAPRYQYLLPGCEMARHVDPAFLLVRRQVRHGASLLAAGGPGALPVQFPRSCAQLSSPRYHRTGTSLSTTRGCQTLSHPVFRFKTSTVGQKLPPLLRGSSFPLLQVPRGPVAVVNRTARAKKGARCLTRAGSHAAPSARARSPPSLPRASRGHQTNGGLKACSTWGFPPARTCKAEIFTRARALRPSCVSAPTARCLFASPRLASVDLSQASPSRQPDTIFTSYEIGTQQTAG